MSKDGLRWGGTRMLGGVREAANEPREGMMMGWVSGAVSGAEA